MTDELNAPALNLDVLLRQIIIRAREIIPFEGGGIATLNPETQQVEPRIYDGPAHFALAQRVADSRHAIIANDLASDPRFGPLGYSGAAMATPLILQDRLYGVIEAYTTETDVYYTPPQLKVLETLADQAALALHTAQLYGVLAKRYKRMSSYNEELFLRNEVSRLAASDTPLEVLLPQMLGHLAMLLGANACAVTLWDAVEQRPVRLSAYGLDLGEYLSARRRPEGAPSLTGEIVAEGKPLIINEASSLPEPPSPLIREYEVRALLAMPLVARGRNLGVVFIMNLSNDEPYTQQHAERAGAMLDQIAMTVDNRILLQDMQDRLSETTALLAIAALAASSLDIGEMLQAVLRQSRQMFRVTSGAFLLYDRASNTLAIHPAAHFGIPADMARIRFHVTEPGSHIAIVFTSGSPYFTNDTRTATQDTQEAYTALIARLGLRNLLLAPLRVQDEPIGVVMMGNKRGDFTRADAQLLMAMGSHVAAALRNRDLLTDMRERLRETEALQRIAAITSATLDLDEMLERAVREAAELLETEGALLMLVNPEGTALVAHQPSRYGIARDAFYPPLSLDPDAPVTDDLVQVFRSGEPLISNRPGGPTQTWRGSLIAFPLRARNRTLGTLTLMNRQTGDFGDVQIELTRAIASQIATSMENAQLFAAERRRADLTTLVNRINQELTATLSAPELTRKVVKLIHERIGYEAVNVMLLDESGLNLTVRSSISSDPAMVLPENYVVPSTRSIIGRAMRTGETQLVPDTSEDPDYFPFGNQPPIGSMVVVPVRYGARTLGVLEALSSWLNAFQKIDTSALETLAAQVSIALENARLWDQARKRLLEQGIVHQISQDLSKILDYSELANAVVKHMARALDTSLCALASHDADTGQTRIEAEYCPPDLPGSSVLSLMGKPLGAVVQSAIDRAIRTRRQVVLSRDALRSGMEANDMPFPVYSQLILPMVAGDRVSGCVLWLETRTAREFTGSDVRLAQTLTTQAAIAFENARLFRQAQRQAHEQTLLRRVAVGLSNMPDVDAMLEQFAVEIAQSLTGVSNVAIAIRGSDNRLKLRATYLTSCAVSDMLLSYLSRPGVEIATLEMLKALESGASMQVGGLAASHQRATLNDYFAHRAAAVLLTPIMRRRREILGLIEISVDSPSRIFEPFEIQLVEALANQSAIAFDNITLHQREQRRLRQLERLQEASRRIAAQLNQKLLLDVIAQEASQIFETPAVSLMIREPGLPYYAIRASVGLSEGYVKARRATVIDFEQPLTLAPEQMAAADPAYEVAQEELIRAEGLVNVVSVPVVKGGQQLGLLNVYGKGVPRVISDEEKELMHLFAGQAAVALENARLFEELGQRNTELTEANRLKSEFLARVSHELRTPMNSINGYSEMLLRQIYGPVNDKQGDRIERILRNGKNLLALIDDLLDIAKIDAGRMELQIEPVDLREEVRATLHNLESQAATRGLNMHMEVSEGLPPVRADAMRLRQILNNLLSNALKFTKQGSVTVRSEARPSPDGAPMLWTTVEDTGIGIRPEHQTIIFDEFRQADGSTTREYGGTGLGLAITKKLVEMMHGRIWVESEMGQGSAFTFTLPVMPPPAEETAEQKPEEPENPAS